MSKSLRKVEMNYKPQLLPIGLASFKTMVQENFIYVDKTHYIYELITQGKYYFLSRPRRFGKSLLLSTLEQIFLGNKQLFSPFFIATTNYNWTEYPVIHFSFSSMSSKTVQEFENDIRRTLERLAYSHGIDISDAPSIKTKFKALIKRISINSPVAILIDEYDHPLLNNIHDSIIKEACNRVLHDFLVILKGLEEYIRFTFITGITKFSATTIFSGLNNLNDLTDCRSAATLLGYTKEEILKYFELQLLAKSHSYKTSVECILEQMQAQYNEHQSVVQDPINKNNLKVYNPFSVLSYLNNKQKTENPILEHYP